MEYWWIYPTGKSKLQQLSKQEKEKSIGLVLNNSLLRGNYACYPNFVYKSMKENNRSSKRWEITELIE